MKVGFGGVLVGGRGPSKKRGGVRRKIRKSRRTYSEKIEVDRGRRPNRESERKIVNLQGGVPANKGLNRDTRLREETGHLEIVSFPEKGGPKEETELQPEGGCPINKGCGKRLEDLSAHLRRRKPIRRMALGKEESSRY